MFSPISSIGFKQVLTRSTIDAIYALGGGRDDAIELEDELYKGGLIRALCEPLQLMHYEEPQFEDGYHKVLLQLSPDYLVRNYTWALAGLSMLKWSFVIPSYECVGREANGPVPVAEWLESGEVFIVETPPILFSCAQFESSLQVCRACEVS